MRKKKERKSASERVRERDNTNQRDHRDFHEWKIREWICSYSDQGNLELGSSNVESSPQDRSRNQTRQACKTISSNY